jgi:hypothetical protein
MEVFGYFMFVGFISAMTGYSILALVLYDSKIQMAYLPFGHMIGFLMPLFLFSAMPLPIWGYKDYWFFSLWYWGIYLCFILICYAMLIVYTIEIVAMNPLIKPIEASVYSSTLFDYQLYITIIALVAIPFNFIFMMIYKKYIAVDFYNESMTGLLSEDTKKTAKQQPIVDFDSSINKVRMYFEAPESVIHTAAWMVAWSELVIPMFHSIGVVPIWIAIDSPNTLLIGAIMCWVYQPVRSMLTKKRMIGLLTWLALGLSCSITAWIYDVYQVEGVALYLDSDSYKDLFDGNVTVPIRDVYRYTVSLSNIELFVSATILNQTLTILWIVIGSALFTTISTRLIFK